MVHATRQRRPERTVGTQLARGDKCQTREKSLQVTAPRSTPILPRSHRRNHQSFMAPSHKERRHAFFILAFHSSFMVIV